MSFPFSLTPSEDKYVYYDRELDALQHGFRQLEIIFNRIRERQKNCKKVDLRATSVFNYAQFLVRKREHPEQFFMFDCLDTRITIRYHKQDKMYFIYCDGWKPSADTLRLIDDEMKGSVRKISTLEEFRTFTIGSYDNLADAVCEWSNIVFCFFKDMDFNLANCLVNASK